MSGVILKSSNGGQLKIEPTSTITNNIIWSIGIGSPESIVSAPVGSLYTRTDGGTNTTLYVKESGTGSTGWVAK